MGFESQPRNPQRRSHGEAQSDTSMQMPPRLASSRPPAPSEASRADVQAIVTLIWDLAWRRVTFDSRPSCLSRVRTRR